MDDTTAETYVAIQNVVDRVAAYQDGAPERTVEHELRDGLEQAGVVLDDARVERLAAAIDAADGDVSVREVLA